MLETARFYVIIAVSALVAGYALYFTYRKGWLAPLLKKIWLPVVLAGLCALVVYLVRANYVWIGFQAKGDYAVIQHCQANIGPLEYELSALKEARNTAFEMANTYNNPYTE